MQDKKNWNVKELLNWTTQYLTDKQFENPRVNVEWLLSDTLKCRRLDLYVDHDRPLRATELEEFKLRLKRRLNSEPLQYIVGSTEFMGLPMAVTKAVLIPRPDTERLVEKVLESCLLRPENDAIRILDIGTGSGAIAIALAYYIKKKGRNAVVTAIDVSEDALAMAHLNAARSNATVNFEKYDIFEDPSELASKPFDVVVSNPPYISEAEFHSLPDEVKNFEPKQALWADDNGLAFYERIGHIGDKLLNTGGELWFEMAYDQGPSVRSILEKNGFSGIKIYKDLQNLDRVIGAIR